jgi:hypothetical protein
MSGTILRAVDGEPRYTTTQAAALLGVTRNAIRLRVRIAAARGCAIGEQDRSRGPWRLTQEDLAHLAVSSPRGGATTTRAARTIRRRVETGEARSQVAAASGISLEELAALVDRRSWREMP